MNPRIVLLAVFGCTIASHGHAELDLRATLEARDFATLERELGAVERRFEEGAIDEYALLDAFRPLYMREDIYSAELEAWTKAYPKSYVAHLARGTYYRKLGELNRGGGFANEVPQSSMNYMNRMFDLAGKELDTALPLTKKPYLALLNLMNIARYRSDSRAADAYLRQGNAVLPDNMLLRGRYQDHLKPRWGGSYELMQAFVERSRKESLRGANVGLLGAMIVEDRGLVMETAGDGEGALRQYKEAVRMAHGAARRVQEDYIGDAVRSCRQGLMPDVACP